MVFLQNSITTIWNRLIRKGNVAGLRVGFQIKDGRVSKNCLTIPHHRRQQHVAILGKTGTGKSSLLRYLMSQDIAAGRGFVCIDLHGDLIPFVLSTIAEQEKTAGEDLSSRLLLIDPADPKYAVGLNLIECEESQSRPVQISEMVILLKHRWSLDHFGARTEELLRNCLWVLSENGLTLLEIAPLLTNPVYRLSLLQKVKNQEVKRFFEERYNKASSAMQVVMREAVLNKMTTFTVDPAIRHIVGQAKSSFSLRNAIDQGFWICLSLRKGRLGENASTFAGLFLTKLKSAIFGRRHRNLFTLYADELPNLVAADDAFSTLLSEARKFAVSVVTANQFLAQLSPSMRSVVLSVGTTLCFQLSAEDAPLLARALDGEKSLARRLTTLEHRRLIGRVHEFPEEICVPTIKTRPHSFSSLSQRSLSKFGRLREGIDDEINDRYPTSQNAENLEGWD